MTWFGSNWKSETTPQLNCGVAIFLLNRNFKMFAFVWHYNQILANIALYWPVTTKYQPKLPYSDPLTQYRNHIEICYKGIYRLCMPPRNEVVYKRADYFRLHSQTKIKSAHLPASPCAWKCETVTRENTTHHRRLKSTWHDTNPFIENSQDKIGEHQISCNTRELMNTRCYKAAGHKKIGMIWNSKLICISLFDEPNFHSREFFVLAINGIWWHQTWFYALHNLCLKPEYHYWPKDPCDFQTTFTFMFLLISLLSEILILC